MKTINSIFQCQRCGFCCHGETTVSLDKNDRERMAAFLGLSEEEVAKRYWRVTGGCVQMKVSGGHCIFFNDGCSVHSGRPWRCRQWPLHPSILIDRANFETIRESCPGINRQVTYEEFCDILKKIQDDDLDHKTCAE